MRTISLPTGAAIPAFGIGTWRMGEDPRRRAAEADIVRLALDRGCRLIDTAEMYGEGGAELMLGDAIAGRRDGLYIVSKVYPHNASRRGTVEACERSLRRLRIERIDLYLLHWQGSVPMPETIDALRGLRERGLIGDFGVSNFDLASLQAWCRSDGGLTACNQVMYNLARRGVEFDLLPWQRQRGIVTMAYSPLDIGALAGASALREIARRHDATPAQIALAWLLQQPAMVTIPKTVDPRRMVENLAAIDITLTPDDLAAIDRAYPPPRRKMPLAMS